MIRGMSIRREDILRIVRVLLRVVKVLVGNLEVCTVVKEYIAFLS